MQNKYLRIIYLIFAFTILLNVNLSAESPKEINLQYIENIIQKTNPQLYIQLKENNGIKNFSEELAKYMEKNKIPITTLQFVLRVMPKTKVKSENDIEKLCHVVSETIKDVDLSLRRGNFYNDLRFEVIKRLKSYNKGGYNTEKSSKFGETKNHNQAIKKMEELNRENMKNQIKTRIKETQRESNENEHIFQEEPIHHPN